MAEKKVAPYGAWRSPITSELIVSRSLSLGQVALDGDDIYWVEGRPLEGGRNVIVRRASEGEASDLTPAPCNARTRVHEYGGGAFLVEQGTLYFANFADQRLYRQAPGEEPAPLTPEGADLRFADGVFDRRRNQMYWVREDHTVAGREPANTIVSLDPAGDAAGGQVVVAGHDFYAAPRLSPDGARLAWVTWNHPNMPWDESELWLGELNDDGTVARAERIAGGADESVQQPLWSPDGTLYFISDRSGWWNIYRWREGRAEAVCARAAEFGTPQWVFGIATYAFLDAGRLICAYDENGLSRLAILDLARGTLETLDLPYTSVGANLQAGAGFAVFSAASPTETAALRRLDLATRQVEVLRRTSSVAPDPGYISVAQPVEFPTGEGLTAHAFFYPPQNKDYAAPAGELPPLLVKSHGGPTGATAAALRLDIQYWTCRGIAVLDVNYGGSTGYGRAYRQRLNGKWGIVDVDDCVNGARYLVARGLVDGERLAITGGSAGGYTTLCALVFRDAFQAGGSYYGVSDLEALARDTHKFEARYLDRLIGPYPERRDLYLERSPVHAGERLACRAIFFQGTEDKVVPPNQTEAMVTALREKGYPVAYLSFEGEQHGFRRAENIKRALDAEFYFYSRIFGFTPADPIEPVKIENL